MNPSNTTASCQTNSISWLIQAAVKLLPHIQAEQLIAKLVKEEYSSAIHSGTMKSEDLAVGMMNGGKFDEQKHLLLCEQLKIDSVFVRDVVGLSPGERALIANGIIVGPFDEEQTFIESDVELISRIVESRGASVIASQIDQWRAGSGNGSPSDLVMRTFALLSKHATSRKRRGIWLGDDRN
ncbi:hypothetical protein COOONC_28010, partial [Cooperia oncophora]